MSDEPFSRYASSELSIDNSKGFRKLNHFSRSKRFEDQVTLKSMNQVTLMLLSEIKRTLAAEIWISSQLCWKFEWNTKANATDNTKFLTKWQRMVRHSATVAWKKNIYLQLFTDYWITNREMTKAKAHIVLSELKQCPWKIVYTMIVRFHLNCIHFGESIIHEFNTQIRWIQVEKNGCGTHTHSTFSKKKWINLNFPAPFNRFTPNVHYDMTFIHPKW